MWCHPSIAKRQLSLFLINDFIMSSLKISKMPTLHWSKAEKSTWITYMEWCTTIHKRPRTENWWQLLESKDRYPKCSYFPASLVLRKRWWDKMTKWLTVSVCTRLEEISKELFRLSMLLLMKMMIKMRRTRAHLLGQGKLSQPKSRKLNFVNRINKGRFHIQMN